MVIIYMTGEQLEYERLCLQPFKQCGPAPSLLVLGPLGITEDRNFKVNNL